MRDFYDIFTLLEVKVESVDLLLLKEAIAATFGKGGTGPSPENTRLVPGEVDADGRMREIWSLYQSKSDYAHGVAWEDAVRAASRPNNALEGEQGKPLGV